MGAAAVGPGPENGRFLGGLEGWTVEGREPVEIQLVNGRPRAVLARNSSLVTAPTVVPAQAQALAVSARAPRGRALVVVRALPERGDPVTLGVLEPGGRLEEHLVGGLAELSGSVVRFEVDPVTSLGRTVQIGGVGPFRAPLTGWKVARGVPAPIGRGGDRYLVADEPLRAIRGVRLPPRATSVSVRIRGQGSVQLTVAGTRRRLRATETWRTLRVPITTGARRISIGLLARPGFAPLQIANPGAIQRRAQDTTRRA